MTQQSRVFAGVGILCASVACGGPTAAWGAPITFAQFSQRNTAIEPFSYTSTGSSATLTTGPGGETVYFAFQTGSLLGAPLPAALSSPLPAHLVLNAVATVGGVYDDYASQTQQRRGTATDSQPFDSLSAVFTLDSPYLGRSNLLTLTVTPTLVGTAGQENPTLTGTDGQQAATLSVGTSNLIVTYSSDFLDFRNTLVRDAALSFSAVNPSGIRFDSGAQFLQDFIADATGTFDSDPPPTTLNLTPIPEPRAWLLLAAGLLGFGALRRLRPG